MSLPKVLETSQYEKNPFRIPKNNADIIRLREAEKVRRAQARENNRKLKLWEKGRSIDRSVQGQNEPKLLKSVSVSDRGEHSTKSDQDRIEKALDSFTTCHAESKECMSSFITKKREMFLLQMSLNVKRNEIFKIEERARLKEEALKRSELMLEEDGIRFDEFLKENDKKAQNAIRKAELETKKKLDKIQEIKKINHSIQAIQAEITKHSETLQECLKYKNFLHALTPFEWTEEQQKKKLDRQKKRRRNRIEKRKEAWIKQEEEKITNARAKIEADAEAKESRDKSRRRKQSKSKKREITTAFVLPFEPDFEDEILTSSGDDFSMYFEEPRQFLDVFSGLEQENLFLIKNKQESEQALEEIKQKNMQTGKEMSEKVSLLEQNILELKAHIEKEENKSRLYIQRIETTSHNNVINGTKRHEYINTHSDMFMKLGNKVKEVYSRCIFDDSGTAPTTLFMLSELEARMGNLLMEIGDLPEKFVRKEMKEKEKKRREIKRIIKLEAQQKAQDERNKKALERSMEPPKKRTTKPIMFRSRLIKQKKKEVIKEITDEEQDEIRYLT